MNETSFLQQENISFSTGLTLFSGRVQSPSIKAISFEYASKLLLSSKL